MEQVLHLTLFNDYYKLDLLEVLFIDIKIKGVYKHFKGDLYLVEDIGYDCETLEKLVCYRALYGEGKLWVRPISSFCEEVNKNGQKYRYEFQNIQSKRED